MRRILDVSGALVLLVLLSPFLAIGAVAVLLDTGRPILFGHERIGVHGRRFRCWKLRTMRSGAEQALDHEPDLRASYIRNGYKLPNGRDPRVTRSGRWLRRTYIDEIPQLFNVIAGTMSLVGPRPIVPDELMQYGRDAADLLSTKPGITGAWTVRGRERPAYPVRASIELDYVRTRTAGRDLAILFRTIPVVLRGQDDG